MPSRKPSRRQILAGLFAWLPFVPAPPPPPPAPPPPPHPSPPPRTRRLVVPLAYQAVPAWVWSAPVPLVGLAGDAQDQWHAYRRALPCCDLVLADAPTVERLHQQGIAHARPANLFGLGRAFLEQPADEG